MGAIVAPLTQLLALVSAPLRDLHGLIDARIEQLEKQGEVVEPAPAEEAVGAEEPTTREAEDERVPVAVEASAESAVTPSDSASAESDGPETVAEPETRDEAADEPETKEEE